MLPVERPGLVTPGPVPVHAAGSVHPRFAPQTQNILQGNDAKVGNRSLSSPHECPMHALLIKWPQIGLCLAALAFCCPGLPPAPGGVVVVGAGIHDSVFLEAVREVNMCARIVEPELQ